MAHPYAEHRSEHVARANKVISRAGYKLGGSVHHADEAADAVMVGKGVHEHESAMHKGEPKTKLKLRDGGHMEAGKAKKHLAKRARGGATPKHKGGVGKVQVIVAPQGGGGGGDAQAAHQQGMQQGAIMGAKAMAQKLGAGAPPGGGGAGPPAPAGAPGAGPAPNAMPARPPMQGGAPMGGGAPGGMMRKRGGKVEMDAGAGGGEGRIEKMKEYGKGGFKPKDKMS